MDIFYRLPCKLWQRGASKHTVSVEGWERDSVALMNDPLEIPKDTSPEGANQILQDWHEASKNMALAHAVFFLEENRISDSPGCEPPSRTQCREMWEAVQQRFVGFQEARLATLLLYQEYGRRL